MSSQLRKISWMMGKICISGIYDPKILVVFDRWEVFYLGFQLRSRVRRLERDMIVLAAQWALHRLALHRRTPYLIPEITALTRQAAALRAENAAYTQLAQFGSYFAASSIQPKGVSRLQSYVQGACTIPLLGDTIGYNLTRTAEEHPNLLAVSAYLSRSAVHIQPHTAHQANRNVSTTRLQTRLNYQDFHRHVMNTAQGLLGVGVAPGEPPL